MTVRHFALMKKTKRQKSYNIKSSTRATQSDCAASLRWQRLKNKTSFWQTCRGNLVHYISIFLWKMFLNEIIPICWQCHASKFQWNVRNLCHLISGDETVYSPAIQFSNLIHQNLFMEMIFLRWHCHTCHTPKFGLGKSSKFMPFN